RLLGGIPSPRGTAGTRPTPAPPPGWRPGRPGPTGSLRSAPIRRAAYRDARGAADPRDAAPGAAPCTSGPCTARSGSLVTLRRRGPALDALHAVQFLTRHRAPPRTSPPAASPACTPTAGDYVAGVATAPM